MILLIIAGAVGQTTYQYSFSTSTSPLSTTYPVVYNLNTLTAGNQLKIVIDGGSTTTVTFTGGTVVVETTGGTPLTGCAETITGAKAEVLCSITTTDTYRLKLTLALTSLSQLQFFSLLVTTWDPAGDLSVGNTNVVTKVRAT